MNWLYYLAEANLYLGVFYLAYCLFLTKETYYQLTRAYLIFSCLAAFVLPVLQIGVLKPVETAVATTISYTIPAYTEPLHVTNYPSIEPVVIEQHLTLQDYLIYAYVLGACVLFILLMIKLFNLFKLMRDAQPIDQLNYKVVYLPESGVAFSFFNYLFIGNNAHGANTMIRHELVHIRQKHSFDIVFLELLKIISWFNPFVYLLQNSLKTVHEYIADEQTAAHETDALTYSSFLVNNAYGIGGSSITHSFFNYDLLKKRIIMLNQQRSGSLARLKYLVAVPVCVASLFTSTLAFSKTYGWVDIDPAKPAKADRPKPVPQAQKATQATRFRYPLPTVAADGYEELITYLKKTIDYNKALIKPVNVIVVINFKVTADGKISTAKIATSGGSTFDDLAINALRSYKNAINDKPGDRNLMFDFYANDSTPQEMAIVNGDLKNRAGFVVIIPGQRSGGPVKFPPPAVKPDPALRKKDKNGANVSEGRLNNGAVPIQTVAPAGTKALFIVDGKKYEFTPEDLAKYNSRSLIYMSCDKMTVYEQGNAYAEKTWGKGYGKVAVLTGNASIRIVADPFGDKQKAEANIIPVQNTVPASTISSDDLEQFGKYIAQNVHYPAADRQEAIGGRVITLFAVDADGNLQYAKVVRSPSNQMSDEVIRVLKKWPRFSWFKPGIQYAVPVNFSINVEGPWDGEIRSRVITPNVYNPNAVDIPTNPPGSRMLSEIVIRGYTKRAAAIPVSDAEKEGLDQLGKYFSQNVHYPAADRQETIGGRVITLFSVDADHKLQYAKVVRMPSAAMGNEVIRVLKKCTQLDVLKPGVQYVLPISFDLGYEDSSEIIALRSRSTGIADVYNPNAVDIQVGQAGNLSLNEVVIRGYIKKQ
jgi:TonB family protein